MTRIKLPFIHEYRDRHGKLRRYVRRPGSRRVALPGLPGSPEFMQAYQDAMSGPALRPRAPKAGTLAALAAEFFTSTEFANLKSSSQATYRMVLAPVLELDGHRLVRDLPSDKARKIIQEIGANRPALANLTKSILRRVFSFAIATGQRRDNPFDIVPRYKIGTHHTWSDDQLAAYEKRWPLGTRERLAYDILLYTAQRVGDAVRIQRSDNWHRGLRAAAPCPRSLAVRRPRKGLLLDRRQERATNHAQKPHEADCCRSRGRWASARMCRPRAS
jgi:hypothetical protein